MPAFVFDLRRQPVEHSLSLMLSHADVQPVTKSLDVFNIRILVRHMAEQTDRRATQLQDAVVESRPQIGWRILGDDPSIFHKSHPMTTRGFVHIRGGNDYAHPITLRSQSNHELPEILARD